MKTKLYLICFAALFLIVALDGARPLQANDKVMKLRYANFFPATHAITKLTEEWCREIEKRTEGRVKIPSFLRLHCHRLCRRMITLRKE